MRRFRFNDAMYLATGALALAVTTTACSKKEPPAAAPVPAAAGRATEKPEKVEAKVPAKADEKADEKAAAQQANPEKPAASELTANAWGLGPKATLARPEERCYVLTQGKVRTYLDDKALYHLYAYDVAGIEGHNAKLKGLGGDEFLAPGLFVVPSGTPQPEAAKLKAGDVVLAEWAGSLKHGIIEKVDGTNIDVKYTDLPDTWEDSKLKGKVNHRQVTRQTDGMNPGNYAAAKDQDGSWNQVVLVNVAEGDKWIAQRFAGRVAVFPTADIRPVPVKPSVKVGEKVMAVWVGKFNPGTVKEVKGERFLVELEGGLNGGKPVNVSYGWISPPIK